MSRTFTYIKNDDVLKSFREFQDKILLERPLVISRHGDYSLLLERVSEKTLGLKIINTVKNTVISKRTYDTTNTTEALVSRGARHACQKMSELSDAEVNRRRLQIWKWYILDWQKTNADKTEEMLTREIAWSEEDSMNEEELFDMEGYLHGEYLNLGNTLRLIDTYLSDDESKERFRKFAIEDIMEMTSEDTKDKSIAEAERLMQTEGMKRHTYQFTVSVEATDREHARAALLNYLAGDERIKVQK
jgi:ribosomal protein L20A (L18A)